DYYCYSYAGSNTFDVF
nr:immunoglobulin light chain junction region [Macaca mulatta]MOW67875.1 immunoglobulin light chain junction region [Macaca mulatta]MOW70477.1 immunoglobulin light chain junction region [Macaca mulatta]MOW70551.1 immunoglobulin light chain junction region [Macaca mulatta]